MPGEDEPVPVALRQARVAVSAIFFVHGAVSASWAARLPAVQDELHLSPGLLGLVLAGPGFGALAGSQAGGLLVRRLGGRSVSALAPMVLSVSLGLIALAHSAWALMILLVSLGAADGCTAVAMNAQAVTVQQRYVRPMFNSMHAIRSIGAVAGGLAGVATASLGLTLTAQFVLMAVVLAGVAGAAAAGLPPDAEHVPVGGVAPSGRGGAERETPWRKGMNPRLVVVLLTVMAFLASLVKAAPASWSGVYLRHVGAGTATAAAGYAAFSAGEVIVRLFNDRLVNRLGWVRLIRFGTLCCASALAVALLAGQPAIMLVALVITGAGISAVFPGAFATAGALPRTALVMGQVGFAGNLGWLLVSPIIGGLATVVGLPAALGLVLVAAAVGIAGLAPITGLAAPMGVGRRRPVRADGPARDTIPDGALRLGGSGARRRADRDRN